jgi:hypothetical protein
MAATTIGRAALVDSVSSITGDIWNAALVGTALYDKVDALFTASLRIERSATGVISFTVAGASNTAGSDAQLIALVAGTTAGDPFVQFTVTSGSTWTIGADNSSSDRLVIAATTALGSTADCLDIATASCVISLRDAQVTHGMTSLVRTDVFGVLRMSDTTAGGMRIDGYSETTTGLTLLAVHTTDNTTHSTLGLGVFNFIAAVKSGTTAAGVGVGANMVSFQNNGITRFMLDGDGNSWQDVGTAWTNFDDHEDVDLLHALSAGMSRRDDPVRRKFTALLKRHRATLERAGIVTYNRDGHHFVNWSRFNMLITGAIRQQAARTFQLDRRIARLEAAAQ